MNNTNQEVKVGDLFQMSWGYDQTNVNYFQVTRTTPKGVYVREVGLKSAGGEGFMCQNVLPVKDNFLDRSQWCGGFNGQNEETFHRIKFYDGKPCFTVNGRYFARYTDGNTQTYQSWYA